jgi:hypothetical protein
MLSLQKLKDKYTNSSFRYSNASLDPDHSPHNTHLSLIEIPVTVRLNFWQHFFINGGLLLDFDITKNKHLDNQTGIGAMWRVGAKYDFKNMPIGLFLNPYAKYRPLVPFTERNYHLRTFELGFRVAWCIICNVFYSHC